MSVQLKTLEETKTHATLALGGRLDASGAWEIERDTRDYFVGTRHLLIDISGVEFLGSTGIRVFVRLATELLRAQRKLVLFGAQPSIEKTLSMSGITSAIPVVQTLKDAMTTIAQ